MTVKFPQEGDDFGFDQLPDRPVSRQRILVVEDEGDLRQLNAEVLMEAGYQVDVAENGVAAWAALLLANYDLLITDQFLPKLSGVELLKKIHDARMTLAIIMVTEILPTWEFALHPCLQAVSMLRKPYTIEKFLGMVKSVLVKTPRGNDGIVPLHGQRELEAAGSTYLQRHDQTLMRRQNQP